MRYFFIFLILVACTLAVTAIDCNKIKEKEQCVYIENSNINDDEKDLLRANLVYSDSYKPNHNVIYDWNTAIDVTTAPDGVVEYSNGYINNAWVKIFTAMPSVTYKNNIYVPSDIEVLSDYGYTINLPTSTSGSNGECLRTYELLSKSEEFKLYNNNNFVSNKKKANVNIFENSTLKANLKVTLNYKINHYYSHYKCMTQCYKYCCKYDWVCEYEYSTDHKNILEIPDYYNLTYYEEHAFLDFELIQKYAETNKVRINTTHSYKLSVDDGFYESYKYFYDVVYKYTPYYFLYLQAEDINQTVSFNTKLSDNYLYFKADECYLKYWDWFGEEEKKCDLSDNIINLSIELSKYKYNIGEEINIKLYPSDKLINVSYGEESKLVKDKTVLYAKKGLKKITAEVGEIKTQKIIHIKQTQWWLFSVLLALTGVVYIIYLILKRYLGDYIE